MLLNFNGGDARIHGSCNIAGNELLLESVRGREQGRNTPAILFSYLGLSVVSPLGEPKQQSSLQGAEGIQSSGAEHTEEKSREWI